MPHDPTAEASLESAVERSRRRLLLLSGLRWGCVAAAIALAGPVLLLALGADRFPPALLWVFVAAGLGWAGWKWSESRPEAYAVAQALDRRWDLKDQLSTAWFFSENADEAPLRAREQRSMALQATAGHDVDAAFPYSWPKAATFAMALLGLAFLLFGVRVAMQPELSLRPPLQEVLFPSLAEDETELASLEEQQPPPPADAAEDPQSLSKRGEQAERRETPEKQESTLPPSDAIAPEQQGDAFEMPEVEGLSVESEPGDDLAFESQDPGAEGSEPGEEAAGQNAEEGESSTETAQNEKDAEDWNDESGDLLDRLKNAFQDMMENLGMEEPPQSAANQQQQAGEGQQQEGAEPSTEAGEQSQSSAEAGAEGSEAEMEGGEQGQGEPEQAAQGEATQSSSEEGTQPGESAGASGSAEGSKELAEKMAEQEAALDALEEFYMQRAEEIEGEIMVETSTAEQSAQTPYQASRQAHSDRGGAVTRDEVPLAYQRYIETYFRNLRRNQTN